jgi:hypothetical protein
MLSDGTFCAEIPAGAGPVAVNMAVCRELAELLRSYAIPADREESSLPPMSADDAGDFYLLLVAICHQTSPRGKPPVEGDCAGHHLRGWDYLSAKLASAALGDRRILTPEFWANITEEEIGRLFRDKALGERLSDPAGRAILVRDLGRKMLARSWTSATQLYAASRGRIATGTPNLLDLLSDFRAYQDPVRKKSFFFLALMHNAGLWSYADPGQLGAPVDYHEVRGHLRIGTVEICDPELRARIVEGREVTIEQDVAIRQAVHQALMFVSEDSGLHNPSQLHYLFWNVFRSCCARDVQHCRACAATCSLPDRYVPLALFPSGARRCPFSPVCKSVDSPSKLVEHIVDTDYY